MNPLWPYRAATTLAGPLIRLHLARRRARGKEDGARFDERLGVPGVPRPVGTLIWIHAASVGESLSLLPLIERLRQLRPAAAMLMTTGTVTSARLMAARLPSGVIHQYAPVDRLPYVRRFLGHWRPDAAIWAESEFWPNLVTETAARGTTMILVQGRISARSFAGWKRHRGMIATILSAFALCLAQTEADAERLCDLGAGNVLCRGNLKFAKPALPVEENELARLQSDIGGRPCWLAASTHPGEEVIAAEAHQRLKPAFPGLLSLIVPRHPERGASIAEDLTARGLKVARRAAGEAVDASVDAYIGDTIGELGLFYRTAPIAFIGKSLAGDGGQNPLEAAQLGCVAVFGPAMSNFAAIAAELTEHGAAVTVTDAQSLAETVAMLLSAPDERARRGGAAIAVADAHAGGLDRVAEAIVPFLPRTG